MKHLDLFSGIGGFAIAVDEVFPNSEHIFCDNDKFCRQVLKKHWPNSKIYEDIRGIKDKEIFEFSSNPKHRNVSSRRLCKASNIKENREGKTVECGCDYENSSRIDILTGGFPCQPFSQAGKRRGTEDDRHLWPEMLRVIRLAKPEWVIAENVRGLLTQEGGMVFEQVCLDLEASGYEVQPFIIPAVAVNAPHRRDRVWFIAHRRCERQAVKEQQATGSEQYNRNAPDSKSGKSGKQTKRKRGEDFSRRDWEANWLEVATELCGMDDGVQTELDFAGWTKVRHRVERLKSLGNAIVPQVAIEIMKSLLNKS